MEDLDARINALRKAPRALKELCFLAYGQFQTALPRTGNLNPSRPIPPEAFVDADQRLGDEDLLHRELSSRFLLKLFAKELEPNLTEKRRIELYVSVLERLPAAERSLLEYVRTHRALPHAKINHGVVATAWPDLLDQQLFPAVVPGITYGYPVMDNPTHIEEPAPAAAQREMTAEETHYQGLMRRLGWGEL